MNQDVNPWTHQLAYLCFFLAFVLSFLPVYVDPCSKIRIKYIDDNNFSICTALATGLILKSSSLQSYFQSGRQSWNSSAPHFIYDNIFIIPLMLLVSFVSFLILVFLLDCILIKFILIKLFKREFIRPLYCKDCNIPMRKINSPLSFLNWQEQVAAKIKSIRFEAWYCSLCNSAVNRDSIHLRAYVNTDEKFKECPDCQELTMVEVYSKVTKEIKPNTDGQRLVIHKCQCCFREETKVEVIPNGY
ncbi:MAG: hypothetical protein HXY43_24790 [Fischerella sp.]|uniref:hypothetical protein n=1 Tax=Fischerella sp. TaxID=1191 RepID=UPI0017D622BE|nr:hypothetical protein [Fischerella sp.]NWF62373.1 hypothetical protein [Fischerella sp.]